MIKRIVLIAGIISLMMLLPVTAEKPKLDVNKDVSGYGGIFAGQVIRGLGSMGEVDHAWMQGCYLGMKFDATINERFQVILDGQIHLNFSYYVDATYIGKDFYGDMFSEAYAPYLREAHGIYTFGDLELYPLKIHVGKFHYKYNPQVRNLGEYLFRGSAYPTYMYNSFDDPTAPLMGLMLSSHPWEFFTLDIMLSSETQRPPIQDWSLSGVGSVKIGEFVEFGGGLCLDRVFPKDDAFTTPINEKNIFLEFDTDSVRDGNGDAIFDYDPIMGILVARMDTTVTDSFYYTFKSVKAMCRLNIDPKALFNWENVFGEEDLKLYAEVGFLGLKDYKGFYDSFHERIPWMFGFNFPTFKTMDVLALEFEFFNNPYIPGYRRCFREGIPAPKSDQGDAANFYWSIYAKKSIGSFSFVTQFARDHIHPNINNMWFNERDDVLVEKNNWWWAFKVHYGF